MFEGVKKGNNLNDMLDELILSDSKNKAIEDWNTHKLTPFNMSEWINNKIGYDNDESFRIRKKLESKMHNITGWLHKDGMTLLFSNA